MRVVDSSVVVSALIGVDADSRWAEAAMLGDDVAAPTLMQFEAANVIRRSVIRGAISIEIGTAALTDLQALSIDSVPFEVVADRSWELRDTVTMYDAAFIAAAELLAAPLFTLDRRLATAPGPRCPIVTPEAHR